MRSRSCLCQLGVGGTRRPATGVLPTAWRPTGARCMSAHAVSVCPPRGAPTHLPCTHGTQWACGQLPCGAFRHMPSPAPGPKKETNEWPLGLCRRQPTAPAPPEKHPPPCHHDSIKVQQNQESQWPGVCAVCRASPEELTPHSRPEPLAYTNLCTPRATRVHGNAGSRHGLVSVGKLFPEQLQKSSQDATLAEERSAAFPRCWRTMPTVHEEILNSWKTAGLLQDRVKELGGWEKLGKQCVLGASSGQNPKLSECRGN